MTDPGKYYAAQLGIGQPTQDAAAKTYLLELLDDLESVRGRPHPCRLTQRKAALGDQDAVTNDTVGHAYLENFALNIFLGADNQDRDGRATKYVVVLTPEIPRARSTPPHSSWNCSACSGLWMQTYVVR